MYRSDVGWLAINLKVLCYFLVTFSAQTACFSSPAQLLILSPQHNMTKKMCCRFNAKIPWKNSNKRWIIYSVAVQMSFQRESDNWNEIAAQQARRYLLRFVRITLNFKTRAISFHLSSGISAKFILGYLAKSSHLRGFSLHCFGKVAQEGKARRRDKDNPQLNG